MNIIRNISSFYFSVVDCIDVSCDFEVDMCGWNNSVSLISENAMWERHQGPTDTENTGPTKGHGGVGE